MDEYVDCWYIHKTKNDHVKYFADWWQRDLADMAEKDFKLYSMCLSALRAGAYDLLNKELQMRIERSRKSCSKFFGWRM